MYYISITLCSCWPINNGEETFSSNSLLLKERASLHMGEGNMSQPTHQRLHLFEKKKEAFVRSKDFSLKR